MIGIIGAVSGQDLQLGNERLALTSPHKAGQSVPLVGGGSRPCHFGGSFERIIVIKVQAQNFLWRRCIHSVVDMSIKAFGNVKVAK